jgi:hypothetical protein
MAGGWLGVRGKLLVRLPIRLPVRQRFESIVRAIMILMLHNIGECPLLIVIVEIVQVHIGLW